MNPSMIIIVLASCVVAAFAGHQEDYSGPAHYQFDYSVHDAHTGDIKQQHEVRDGHVVKGAYSLSEADGTKRIVEYVAGPHTGFNAVVKRLGTAQHPQTYQHHGGHGHEQQLGGHFGGAESSVGPTHYGSNGYH